MLGALETIRPLAPTQAPEAHAGEPAAQPDRAIVCASCGHTVTTGRHRAVVNGAHEHRFMNLEGSTFHIACFSEAVGCTVRGPASREYPWFPGFLWRFAHCGGCYLQLGWQFEGEAEPTTFFAFIVERLREADASPGGEDGAA